MHLNELACMVLDSIPKGTAAERVFDSELSPENVSLAFLRARRRAGVEDFRLHDLRHSCASWMRMRGADLQDVAKQLGHSDLRMSDRYANLSQAHLLAAVKKADGVFVGVNGFFPIPEKALDSGKAGHDEVTIELENSAKVLQAAASAKRPKTKRNSLILTSVAEPQQVGANCA